MKVSKNNVKVIIESILPSLMDVTEETKQKVLHLGSDIIKDGQEKDANNKWIERDQFYFREVTVRRPVNHERRLNRIIERASTREEMTTMLADYVCKYGIPKPKTVAQ